MNNANPANEPLPVTIVSGYLGAGKTTFINGLLQDAHGIRVTVLVNDFGTISLDESLIVNRDGDVVALANGCMCCQIGGDLFRTIDRILQRRTLIDHLVIETSGVADPAKIADIARAEPDMQLAHVMTLVDALNFQTVSQDEKLADTLLRQERAADILLVTKGELADKVSLQQLEQALRKRRPEAWHFSNSVLARSFILQAGSEIKTSSKGGELSPLRLETHKVDFESWSWTGEEVIPKKEFLRLIENPELGVYRCKGLLRFDDNKPMLVQKVGASTSLEPVQLQPHESTICFIGPATDFCPVACQQAWEEMLSGPP